MRSNGSSLRFARCGSCLVLLWSPLLAAQTSYPAPGSAPAPAADRTQSSAPPSLDELATPEEDSASDASVVPAAPPSVVVERPAPRRAPSIRSQRRLALTGELGWNGLAGLGAVLTYHADPHLSFELGAGLGAVGLKAGVRTRFNLLEGPLTPFIGAGLVAASGWDSSPDLTDPSTKDRLNLKIKPSAFLQAVVGIDWTSQRGFTLVGALGYAWLLSGNNVVILSGEPTAEEREAFRWAFRSSPVISIAAGYSFK